MTGRGLGIVGRRRKYLEGYIAKLNGPPWDNSKDLTLDNNLPPLGSITNKGLSEWSLPASNLGCLSCIPLELLHLILSYADLWTICSLRCTSQGLLQITESVLEYRYLQIHAPNVIRAANFIGASHLLTMNKLCTQLTSSKCLICCDFGEFLYLPTCERVCFFCLISKHCFLPLKNEQALRQYRLNRSSLSAIPRFRVPLGLYSPYGEKVPRDVYLFDRMTVFDAGLQVNGDEAENPGGKLVMNRCDPYPSWNPIDLHVANPLRFAMVVKFPWLNKSEGSVEWGLGCRACYAMNSDTSVMTKSRKRYTSPGLLEHELRDHRIDQDPYTLPT